MCVEYSLRSGSAREKARDVGKRTFQLAFKWRPCYNTQIVTLSNRGLFKLNMARVELRIRSSARAFFCSKTDIGVENVNRKNSVFSLSGTTCTGGQELRCVGR